jgi:hypothetical protein
MVTLILGYHAYTGQLCRSVAKLMRHVRLCSQGTSMRFRGYLKTVCNTYYIVHSHTRILEVSGLYAAGKFDSYRSDVSSK